MMNSGMEVIIVSSGAIATGVGKLNLREKPKDIAGKQAMAAIGQCELMYIYDKEFSLYNHTVAQILLTAPDLDSPDRHKKFENTVEKLLEYGALPIINENDTVATEEIEFGDNDTLAARVAASVGAELLVLMSDIDGLYTADPHKDPNATLIPAVYEIDEKIEAISGGAGSALGTGGMQTKIKAAKIAMAAGCDMIITNGSSPEVLYKIIDGMDFGTRFYAKG
jgi:glutamate 5-kinase